MFEDNPVVVLTGGTRGITAEVALEMARRCACRLALWGRTPPADEPVDLKAEKARIKTEIEATGERATPAKVAKQLKRFEKAEEARQNLEEMRRLGAEVAFFCVDMADPDAVADGLKAVAETLGPVAGVVHGAGVEVSRLIAEKDEEDFHFVFDGKAVGGLALVEHLPDSAFFVSMGSIAGRFGNPGQVDYAAANEAMARVCLSRPRSLHVDWTAWADVGMAVRGGMDTLLTKRGVELLPARAGSALLVDLILADVTGEVVVAGALGGFPLPPVHALLDELGFDGDAVVCKRRIATEADPWIVDHSIEGTPVLPGVVGLELMAAAAWWALPGGTYRGARDVSFSSPVKLHRGEPVDLTVRAESISPTEVRCALFSHRVAKTGRVLDTEHFQATLVLGEGPEVKSLPPAFFTDASLSRSAIYRRFFHGPSFQVLREARAVTQTAILAHAQVEHAFIAMGLLSAPLVLEAAFQAAGLHRMALDGVMALPASIEEVVMLSGAADGAELKVVARRDGDHYDVDVDGPDGPVMRVRGFALVELGPLPPGDRIPEPDDGWPKLIEARVSQKGTKDEPIILTDAERADIDSRGTERRKADRRLGRMAAKDATGQLTGREAAGIEIQTEPSGRPVIADGGGAEVSISHRGGKAVAVATLHGHPGIDLEVVEKRPPSFVSTWFSEAEAALCGDDPRKQSQIWAAKEAVLKALGEGMRLRMVDVAVVALDPHHATVELRGEAAAHAWAPSAPISVEFEHRETEVLAMVLLAA